MNRSQHDMDPHQTNGWHQTSLAEFHALADRYGTPYFLYDADEIIRRINSVRDSLDRLVEVYYAVKANPNLELLRILRTSADGLDISSLGELEQACLAGYNTGKISFAGPAKTNSELTESIQRGVGCISIESPRELMECVRISAQLGQKANIVVRVNPQFLNRSFGMKMGGKAAQFGVDEEELGAVFDQVLVNTNTLDFRGIHIYAGSQCFESPGIVAGVQNCLSIACQIEARTGLVCEVINLGGGFGASHTEDRELDLKALAEELTPILRQFHAASPVKRRVVFELGRFLTADAGIYVSRVISSKESRGKTFFMVDGGLHHHLAAAGSFGAAFRANFLQRNLSRPDAPAIKCSIAGPSCNPTDLLGIDVELARPEIGDLIGVLKSGSYGFTASPLLFLGRQTPAELIRHRGEVILARRPRTIVDFN
jgi:diaminopimelate decarboxylase